MQSMARVITIQIVSFFRIDIKPLGSVPTKAKGNNLRGGALFVGQMREEPESIKHAPWPK